MLTALAGLAGVVLGGLLQLSLVRMHTMQEQRRTYEGRKYEKRSELYLKMMAYVDHMERVAGRGYDYTYGVKVPKKESVKHSKRDMRSLSVELKVYGSRATGLAFTQWAWHYAEHRAIMANDDGLAEVRDACELPGLHIVQSKFILEIASGRAGRSADKLAEQVQAELIGEDSYGVWIRIRRLRYSRINKQTSSQLDECIKIEAEKLYEVFRDAREKISASKPPAGVETSDSVESLPC